MTTLRGFGMTFANGGSRAWYVGADGVQRWADNDEPVDANEHWNAAIDRAIKAQEQLR